MQTFGASVLMPTTDCRTPAPPVALIAGVLVALPVALTLVLPDWYFSSPGGIDPWLYNGFFRHLDQYASTLYPNTYYGTRLAWILPGHAAYSLFQPETAALVLHVTFYLAAIASLYYTISRTTDRTIALGCAVAFGLFLPAARGLGDDYVAAGVVTYALMAMALAAGSVTARHRYLLLLVSGGAAAAMFHSNIAAALLVPTILIWIVPVRFTREAWTSAILGVLVWLAGAVLCTIVLGELSVRHGGTRLFFVRSFTWWQENNASNPWDQKDWNWVFVAPWAFLPVLTAIASIGVLLQRRRRERLDAMKTRALVAFAYIVGLFVVWDLLGSAAFLYWPFYTSWLTPVSFVVLGAVVFGTLPVGRLPEAAAFIVIAALLLVSLAEPVWIPIPLKVAGLLTALGTTLAGVAVRQRALAVALIGILLAHINLWASTTGFFSSNERRIEVFRAVDDALDHIEPFVAATRQPLFLYNEKEPDFASHYSATAGIYLWGYSIVTRTYPVIDEAGARMLQPGRLAAVLASRPEPIPQLERALAPYALRAELVTTKQVSTPSGPFYLTIFRALEPAP